MDSKHGTPSGDAGSWIDVPSVDTDTIGKGTNDFMGYTVVKTKTKEELMGGAKSNVPEVPY